MNKPEANVWEIIRAACADLLLGAVNLATGQPVSVGLLFDQYPGFVALTFGAAGKLAGATSEYELGEL